MRIFAADDDPIILELLAQFLSIVGQHELVTASCAAEVIEVLAQDNTAQFDCFVLDIQMRGMDGVTLARHIRQIDQYALTPIVMLTALSEKRFIDNAFAAGATDYITKPFDLTELTARIRVIEQLVLSRQTHSAKIFRSATKLKVVDAAENLDLHQPFGLHGIDKVIDYNAMENYTAQLSRSSLFGSTVFAFSLRKPETYCETLGAADFKCLIQDVANVVAASLSGQHFLMSYAGNGTYLCITRSGFHPDVTQLTDGVNLRLSRARIMSNDGAELHPRVSGGAAIRLVWKSGEQIPAALAAALATAQEAATEYERLRTDFFQVGISA